MDTLPKTAAYSSSESTHSHTQLNLKGAFFGGLSSISLFFKGLGELLFGKNQSTAEDVIYTLNVTGLKTATKTQESMPAQSRPEFYTNTTVLNRSEFCKLTGIFSEKNRVKVNTDRIFYKFPSEQRLKELGFDATLKMQIANRQVVPIYVKELKGEGGASPQYAILYGGDKTGNGPFYKEYFAIMDIKPSKENLSNIIKAILARTKEQEPPPVWTRIE